MTVPPRGPSAMDAAARAGDARAPGRRARLVGLVLVIVLVVVAATAAVLRDRGGEAAARPLGEALGAVATGPAFTGVTADFTVENRLVPAGALRPPLSLLLGAGAGGRVWIAPDGRFRLDLRTLVGTARIVSDGRRAQLTAPFLPVVVELPLPRELRLARPTATSLRALVRRLGRYATVSDARATRTADRRSATVRIDPRDDGGLLGAAEVAWDAEVGLPLRGAIFTPAEDEPVLEVSADRVRYGPVDEAALAVLPRAGLPRVDGSRANAGRDARLAPGGHGLPRTVAGLRRGAAQRIPGGAVGVYGSGLGTVVVLRTRATAQIEALDPALGLPEVNIDGATGIELATALGTGIAAARDGRLHVVAGLVPPLVVENAARDLLDRG